MQIAISEMFLDDADQLSSGLHRKCREMLSALKKIAVSNLQAHALPGWRLHKLKSSPFVSLSIDMNYRILGKIEGESMYLHRVVKHDLADAARINRNDRDSPSYDLSESQIQPANIYDAIVALGVKPDEAAPFLGINSEDHFLEALQQVDKKIANIALALYETSGMVIPRTKFLILQHDKEFESALGSEQGDWQIYLHPSQRRIAELPVNERLLVSGSAGTGKTVCAWYRVKYLAEKGHSVGFACANKHVLAVSQKKLTSLLKDVSADVFFLVPENASELIKLSEHVEHLVIDEGQEFPPSWYQLFGKELAGRATGLTLFYDLNQLGGNCKAGDQKRFSERLETWGKSMNSIPSTSFIDLYINYRNSREISDFYAGKLGELLPYPLRYEVPVFGAGDVITHHTSDREEVAVMVAEIIRKLLPDYGYSDIGVVCLSGGPNQNWLAQSLIDFRIPAGINTSDEDRVIVATPLIIRGHERKAIIVCQSGASINENKFGHVINSYIAYSRARDRLIVVEIQP
jgi:hypothetical protein